MVVTPLGVGDLINSGVVANVWVEGDGVTGVVTRYQEDDNGAWNMYTCLVDHTRAFSCWRVVQGEWIAMVEWQELEHIHVTSDNELMMVAVGSQFSFYMDGVPVAEFTDDVLQHGESGIYAMSYEGVTAEFDFIGIYQLD